MFPNAEKFVIHNSCAVPQNVAGPSSSDRSPLRIVFLGRLHWSKGVDALIKSFLQLPAGRAELIVAGTGAPEYEHQLRVAVGSREDVHWLGFVPPDVAFKGAHITVVPSVVNDSAPLVVLESMARGVPVIGSRRGGIPELIGEDAGWTFDPDRRTTLTDALRVVLGSREQLSEMSRHALARARSFSVDNMVDGYLRAYLRARERRGGDGRAYVNV
jgi:glycosyltransferase involved in cell wall biosynthesis